MRWDCKVVKTQRIFSVRHSDGESVTSHIPESCFSPPNYPFNVSIFNGESEQTEFCCLAACEVYETHPHRANKTQPEQPFSTTLCNCKCSSEQQEESTLSCYHALTVRGSLTPDNQVIPYLAKTFFTSTLVLLFPLAPDLKLLPSPSLLCGSCPAPLNCLFQFIPKHHLCGSEMPATWMTSEGDCGSGGCLRHIIYI